MELPMAQPLAPAQEQVQEPVQQQDMQQQAQPSANSDKPFPADKKEALKFSNDLLQVIHDERTHPNIVKQLEGIDDSAKGKSVGIVAGNIVGNRVADVRGQTGRKIEMRMVVNALKAVVNELSEVAEDNSFFTMSKKDKLESIETAIDMLDQIGRNKQQ